jgi:hypothetical protein
MDIQDKIAKALGLGMDAARKGRDSRPMFDDELLKLMGGTTGLITREDTPIVNAWIRGYASVSGR